jgi:hypothetical protein
VVVFGTRRRGRAGYDTGGDMVAVASDERKAVLGASGRAAYHALLEARVVHELAVERPFEGALQTERLRLVAIFSSDATRCGTSDCTRRSVKKGGQLTVQSSGEQVPANKEVCYMHVWQKPRHIIFRRDATYLQYRTECWRSQPECTRSACRSRFSELGESGGRACSTYRQERHNTGAHLCDECCLPLADLEVAADLEQTTNRK